MAYYDDYERLDRWYDEMRDAQRAEAEAKWSEYINDEAPSVARAGTLYEDRARETALGRESLLRWEADFRQPNYYDWFLTEVTR